ncbi:hypothetical protein LTR09_008726 [Extremus antarcticus]|uniref:HET-domain-containing protein n=1 Tax=Extremus antarcticus TaxID=702011 RepID=A0AAJ0DAF1_9PEZI|nr:hypothetical protein LTR09_008726 [Extremus antarcticus]
MRLLDVHRSPPVLPKDVSTRRPYAILSHVWEDNELVFGDLQQQQQRFNTSHEKISGAQVQARRDRLDYVWIDTLCIDKSSSSELGEAINSMYKWYQEAAVCYIYLADLDGCPKLTDADILRSGDSADKRYWGALFRESRWFRRGWTLQELIAPNKLCFFDKSWNFIGTLKDLAATVSDITNIHLSMLRNENKPEDFSIAQRMSWAAHRETTRVEDRAYSLLGVLDITISIRYGEGSQAFTRLQEAIIARDADQSIFAWEKPLIREEDVYMKERRGSYLWNDPAWTQLLAPSPDAFAQARNIVPSMYASLPYRMTNLGLYITSFVPELEEHGIILNCHYKDDPTKAILLNIRPISELTIRSEESQGQLPPETIAHVFLRERSANNHVLSRLTLLDVDQAHLRAKPHTFYISRSFASQADEDLPCKVWLQLLDECDDTLATMQPPLVSRLDFVEPPPTLSFQSSEPPPDSHTSSTTWTLESDSTRRLPCQRLTMYLYHSGSEHGALELHLGLVGNRTVLGLVAVNHDFGAGRVEAEVSLKPGGPLFGSTKLKNQLIVKPGLALRASLQRQHYNGQVMYVIKVCSVRVKVPRWNTRRKLGKWLGGGCLTG